MSESPFSLFGAVDPSAAPEDEPASESRRNIIVLGSVAAVVVAAGAFFLLSGGDEPVVDSAFTPLSPKAAAPAASAKPALLPVVSKIELGRNPFKALYILPAPVVVQAPISPVIPGSPVTGGGAPIVIVGPGGVPTSGGSGTSQPAPVKEYKLVLTRVTGTAKDRSAVFTIDGNQVTAKVGEIFGPTEQIKFVSLQQGPKNGQWTAVLQVGDGDPFDVVTGVPAFVR